MDKIIVNYWKLLSEKTSRLRRKIRIIRAIRCKNISEIWVINYFCWNSSNWRYINDLRHENDERTQGVHSPVVEGYDMPHLSTTAICLSFAVTAFFSRKSRILLAFPWESELEFFLPKIFLLFKKCVHLTLVCKKTTWICDFSKANKSRVYF